MLEKAVAELKGLKIEEEFEPSISLRFNAFIPDDYIDDITLRLSLYRRIALARNEEAVQALEHEIDDRFGKPPEVVRNLLNVMRLKVMARELRIAKIQDTQGRVQVLFSPDTKIEPRDIFELGKKANGRIRFLPEGFELDLRGVSRENVYKEISSVFTYLLVSDSFNRRT